MELLVVCSANQCRSPMAEVLLRRHVERAGVDVTVSSAGLYEGGVPAAGHGVAAMADRGLDLRAHRSRQIDAPMVRGADLIIAMARLHVREVAMLVPEAMPKTFTLKELARFAAAAGPRPADEALGDWVERLSAERVPGSLVGVTHDDELDVADPIGRGRGDYEVTADLLDRLLGEVVELAFPSRARAEGQRA